MSNTIEDLHQDLSELLERYSAEHNVQVREVEVEWTPIAGMGTNGRTHMLAGITVTTGSRHQY